MAPFSAQDILQIWETGRLEHPLDRALTILGFACPDMERTTLATLTIGQRDRLLFDLREQTFGSDLAGIAECPQCGERLEFTITTTEVRSLAESDVADTRQQLQFAEEGWELAFRLPDSYDLAAAAGSDDVEMGRTVLVQRCVLWLSRYGETVGVDDAPDTVIGKLAARMAECDSSADVQLNLNCPACDVTWRQTFDIVTFFWAEIAAQAKRLLREVHTLARAYGWREEDILSMSAARRQQYLEIIGE